MKRQNGLSFIAMIETNQSAFYTTPDGYFEMKRLMLDDIETNFAKAITNLNPGEVVQIVSGDKVVARLIGESKTLNQEFVKPLRKARQPGSAVGTLKIVADDDDHLRDFVD
jgi:antitoxin (DNA-binding transcriptional repressor) of toxin-antitoxin stability system